MRQPQSIAGLSVPLSSLDAEPMGVRGFRVGTFFMPNGLALAPMAGITDPPFRALCRDQGAEYTVAEMTHAQLHLQNRRKTRLRGQNPEKETPFVVQIVGNDPEVMAQAARFHVAQGADIIDINMGCPAKKVCRKTAGAALLADERLVEAILCAVVNAVTVPVSLKFRTGVALHQKNAVRIARIAEAAGIQLLALHGRTRDCLFGGAAEYETIREVKQAVSIPVLANGDIDTPHKACEVLRSTGVDGIMVGRAALGKPWLFREMACALAGTYQQGVLSRHEKHALIETHLQVIHDFYGEHAGVRMARKHLLAYARTLGILEGASGHDWRRVMLAATDGVAQKTACAQMIQMSEKLAERDSDFRKVA